MSIIGSNILAGASGQGGGGGYTIERSVRLRSSASASLSRTFTTPTSGTKWTYSLWMKKSGIAGTGFNLPYLIATVGTGAQGFIGFGGTQADDLYFGYGGAGRRISPALFRDPSAWYHLVFSIDTTQATETNRAKLYVNGVQFSWTTSTAIGLNDTTQINQAVAHNIGRQPSQPYDTFNGYLTEVNFIDGQALTPSDFGEYNADTGVWQPVKYTGTYGTNGFYLDFNDNTTTTTLAEDKSGNGNDWTANNISLTSGVTYDSMTDTPTIYADGGNYCTLNPIGSRRTDGSGGVAGAINGNLDGVNIGSGGWAMIGSTIAIPSGGGKFYFEGRVGATGQSMSIGVQRVNTTFAAPYIVGFGGDSNGYSYTNDGYKWNNGSTAYGSSAAAGDIIGVAVDASGGTSSMEFYKNGVSMGVAFTGITSDLVPAFSSVAGAGSLSINFGQRPFAYTPPSGFLSLHTGNLPDSNIVDGGEYFNTVLYTGNNGASLAVTGAGFQPDFVWVKNRSTSNNHNLVDVVRGANLTLFSNTADDEDTSTERVTSFDADGFTVGTNNGVNANDTYVSWLWKANGAGVLNEDGDIDSTVSANPTAGFSIVTYTGNGTDGATVGHGLSQAPELMINKSRDSTQDWFVFGYPNNSAFSADGSNLKLNTTAAITNSTEHEVSLDSSVITFVDAGQPNLSGDARIAYCFHSIEGFSRFGSYTGNGSSDGIFVYLGFRPAWIMYKRTNTVGNWNILDTSRDPFNLADKLLRSNLAIAEEENTVYAQDFLSNGWKIRSTNVDINVNGSTYIYMAFAEHPFKHALAR